MTTLDFQRNSPPLGNRMGLHLRIRATRRAVRAMTKIEYLVANQMGYTNCSGIGSAI